MSETLILETRENSTTLHKWVISDGTPITNVENGLDITVGGVTRKYYNSAIIYNSNYNENYIFIFGSTANTYLRVFNSSNNGQSWTEQNNRRAQISTNVGDFYRINVYNEYGSSGNGALYAGTNNYIKGEVTQNPFNLPVFDYVGGELTDYINYILSPLMVYEWSSVPSISGNGKTYRLTDILNINDGSPMNDVQYDGNLDFSAKSKVNNLIDSVLQDDSKVTVNYTIPEGNYEYIKLVYKKNRIPDDKTDGTAITLTQGDTSVEISGIADGNIYWFVIFTDVSESEPVKFDTIKHYLVNISAKTGFVDLAGHTIDSTRLGDIVCNGEYFYIPEEATHSGHITVNFDLNLTGDVDLWYETECYFGDEDLGSGNNGDTEVAFELTDTLGQRLWFVTVRNASFDKNPMALDYDYWYLNKLRTCKTIMDDENYCHRWTKVGIKTEIRNGRITKLVTYRDGEIFREDSESSYNVSNITFHYLDMTFGKKPDNKVYTTYRAKYFRLWTEEVTT